MTQWEVLEAKRHSCLAMAKKAKDENLKRFYLNASDGFLTKQQKLTIEEASAYV